MAKFTRRQLFKLKLNDIVKCFHEEETGPDLSIVRPPGAIDESLFSSTCERCHKCFNACDYESISLMGASYGKLESTPMLNPQTTACHVCSDMPCIAACPSGALVNSKPLAKMASIVFNHENCLNSQGVLCDTCATNCPSSIRAIKMEGPFHKRLPTLNEETCIGCGLCIYYCENGTDAIQIKKIRQISE
ncbi:MAG: 4Fe-4S binding protein [Candidatus Cloacimonetes bacterium]|nr:4Fe-4S binding protein [Candidatus Cloacimonadota bacterium]